jgi:hypothetical protein
MLKEDQGEIHWNKSIAPHPTLLLKSVKVFYLALLLLQNAYDPRF